MSSISSDINFQKGPSTNPVEGECYYDNSTQLTMIFTNGAYYPMACTDGWGKDNIMEIDFRNIKLSIPRGLPDFVISMLYSIQEDGYKAYKFANQFHPDILNGEILRPLFLILLQTETNAEYIYEMDEWLLSNV
jgi:hypothetical protein